MDAPESIFSFKTRPPILLGGFFLLVYALGQLIISILGIQSPMYADFYTTENSVRVLLVSLAILVPIVKERNYNLKVSFSLERSRLITIYYPFLLVTLILCYMYPWGILGQELGIGASIKSYFRHAYVVLSLFMLISKRRSTIFIFAMDIVMLGLDPSRVFFVEAIFPKLYFCYSVARPSVRWRYILGACVLLLLIMYVQIVRLGQYAGSFVTFAVYSDIMHSTYPALQLSQYSLDSPWKFVGKTGSFEPFYGQAFAPMGGYFLPGSSFLSANIVVNCVIGAIGTTCALFLFSKLYRRGINMILFSGIVVLFQKLPLINTIKLLVGVYCFWCLFSVLCKVKVSYVESCDVLARKTNNTISRLRLSLWRRRNHMLTPNELLP